MEGGRENERHREERTGGMGGRREGNKAIMGAGMI
jgi:hypothetical protein